MSLQQQHVLGICTELIGSYPDDTLGRGPCSDSASIIVKHLGNKGNEMVFQKTTNCGVLLTGAACSSGHNSFNWSLPKDISDRISIQAQGSSMLPFSRTCSHSLPTSQPVQQLISYDSITLATAPHQYATDINCLQPQPTLHATTPARPVDGMVDSPPGLLPQLVPLVHHTHSVTLLPPGTSYGRLGGVTNHPITHHTLFLQQDGQSLVCGSPNVPTPVNSFTAAPPQDATILQSAIIPSATLLPIDPASTALNAPSVEQLQLQLHQQNALLRQQHVQQEQQALQQQEQLHLKQRLHIFMHQGVQSEPGPVLSQGGWVTEPENLNLLQNFDQTWSALHTGSTHTGQTLAGDQAEVRGLAVTTPANSVYQRHNSAAICNEGHCHSVINMAAAASPGTTNTAWVGAAVLGQEVPSAGSVGLSVVVTSNEAGAGLAVPPGHALARQQSNIETGSCTGVLNGTASGSAGTGVFLGIVPAPVQSGSFTNKHNIARTGSLMAEPSQKKILSSARCEGARIRDWHSTEYGSDVDFNFSDEEICAANLMRLSLDTSNSRHSSADGLKPVVKKECKVRRQDSAPVPVCAAGKMTDVLPVLDKSPSLSTSKHVNAQGSVQCCAPRWASTDWDPKAQVVALGSSASKGTGAFIPGVKAVTGTGAFMPPAVKEALAAAAAAATPASNKSSEGPDCSKVQDL